jgi:hypothetical protein
VTELRSEARLLALEFVLLVTNMGKKAKLGTDAGEGCHAAPQSSLYCLLLVTSLNAHVQRLLGASTGLLDLCNWLRLQWGWLTLYPTPVRSACRCMNCVCNTKELFREGSEIQTASWKSHLILPVRLWKRTQIDQEVPTNKSGNPPIFVGGKNGKGEWAESGQGGEPWIGLGNLDFIL